MIQLLLLEDVFADAELVERELKRGGIAFVSHRVAAREAFQSELSAGGADLILADYGLPSFDGDEALLIARSLAPDVPFIIVTGSLGDDKAVELLRNGATDYVTKDNLGRLVPSVRRALADADERRARREAEAGLRVRDAVLSSIAMAAERLLETDPQRDLEDVFVSIAAAAEVSRARVYRVEEGAPDALRLLEWTASGGLAEGSMVAFPVQSLERWRPTLESGGCIHGRVRSFPEMERAMLEEHGTLSIAVVPIFVSDIPWGAVTFEQCDRERVWSASEVNALEAAGRILSAALTRREMQLALQNSESEYRTLARNMPDVVLRVDGNGNVTYLNRDIDDEASSRTLESVLAKLGYPPGLHEELDRRLPDVHSGMPSLQFENSFYTGLEMRDIETRLCAEVGSDGGFTVLAIVRDVTDLREGERKLHAAFERLQSVDAQRRKLLASLLKAQEDERARLAVDLHDEALQGIAALTYRLEALKRHGVDPAEIDVLLSDVGTSLARIRLMISDLRPPELERHGLVAAVEALVENARAEGALDVTVKARLKGEPLLDQRLVLYRVVQEALSNVRKHAQANHVRIELSSTAKEWRAEISDDGIGFDVEREGASVAVGHLGLHQLEERVAAASGRLECASHAGGGTTIVCILPRETSSNSADAA